MAAEDKIKKDDISVVDPMGYITDSAKKASIEVDKLAKDLGILLPLTEKIFKGKPNNVNDIQLQERALKKLNDEADRARKIEEMATKQKTALARLTAVELRNQKLYNDQIVKETAATDKLTRAQQRSQSAYFKVQDAITSLQNRYKELAIRKEVHNDLSAKEERRLSGLQNAMLKYEGVIRKVDAQMGRHQRNVGNYSSAYNGLGFSMAQLTREAPAFANSVQTGFMALSNNIPIFLDEVQKIKIANKNLASSGQPTVSVFKQIASSIFSLQTAISLGVTLLTLFGSKIVDWVSSLFQSKNAIDDVRLANERLAKTQKEQAEYIAKESNEFSVLLGRLKATNQGSKERSELISQINNQYGTTLQNMSDEAKFQAAINFELNRYLQFKENEFNIKNNEEKIQTVLEKKHTQELVLRKVQKQYNDAELAYNKEMRNYIKGSVNQTDGINYSSKVFSDASYALSYQKGVVEELTKRFEQYAGTIQRLTVASKEFNYKEQQATKTTKEKSGSQAELNKNFDEYLKLKEEELELLNQKSPNETGANGQLINERIKLAEQEISLELENRKGNLLKVLETEVEILKIKSEILRLEYEAKILNTTDDREKQLLILERDLELEKNKTQQKESQNKYDEKNEENRQKALKDAEKQVDIQKELATLSKEAMEIAKDYATNVLEAQVKSIDEQIEMVKKSYSLLEKQAENGNIKANESIKEQMRLELELIEIREKKARQIAFINGLSSLGSSFAGGSSSQSLGNIFSSLQGFETGTETEIGNYVKPNLKGVGKDDIAVRVHAKERIINEGLAKKIQGHKTSDVINGYVQYHQMMANNMIGGQTIDLTETNHLLKKQLDQKPTEYNLEKVVGSAFDIIRTERKGNSIEKRVRRVRL